MLSALPVLRRGATGEHEVMYTFLLDFVSKERNLMNELTTFFIFFLIATSDMAPQASLPYLGIFFDHFLSLFSLFLFFLC